MSGRKSSSSKMSNYYYDQGYDVASENYTPSLGETAGQAANAGVCKATGNLYLHTKKGIKMVS